MLENHRNVPGPLLVWLGISMVPVIPYTIPLFEQALSDSPTAYLIWIPFLAFSWATWNFFRYPDMGPAGRSPWWALLFASVLGFALYSVAWVWPDEAIPLNAGLLLWPLWSSCLFAAMFGFRNLRVILVPMLYLFLVWPPLYLEILSIVDPFLSSATQALVSWFARRGGWVHLGSAPNLFSVSSPDGWITVLISRACSGSDSILALMVLYPVSFALFKTTWLRKLLLAGIGCVVAFAFNVIRICLIIAALHQFGYTFSIDILHPVLGAILFFILTLGLLTIGFRRTERLKLYPPADWHLPKARAGMWVVTGIGSLVTVLLLPLYQWSTGSPLRPLFLQTHDASSLLPHLPGFQRIRIGGPSGQSEEQARARYEYRGFDGGPVVATLVWPVADARHAGQDAPSCLGFRQYQIQVAPGITGTLAWSAGCPALHATDWAQIVRIVFPLCTVYHARRSRILVTLSEAVWTQNNRDPEKLLAFERLFFKRLVDANNNPEVNPQFG